jgi:hypothetical protein
MTDTPSGFRLTSARRGGPGHSPVTRVAVVLAVALVVLIVIGVFRKEPPAPVVMPTPAPTQTPVPAPTRTPTPTPGPVKESSEWVGATVVLPPTPTWAIPTVAPRPRREPRPTPRISECASYTWDSIQVFTPSAQVKIDIRVNNRCPYDLGPGNLMFEITGWRDGGRVQTVRGAPFETIRRGRIGDLSIGLPGSKDWYDEIEITVFD